MVQLKNEIWNKVLTSIQLTINKQSFDMWLKDTEPLSLSGNTLMIKVADEVAQRHISENYSKTRAVFGNFQAKHTSKHF